MKTKFISFFMLLISINAFSASISLNGAWRFALDKEDIGLKQNWQSTILPDKIMLPGSLQEQLYGEKINTKTPWTGEIKDSTFFKAPQYKKYREESPIKVPFWLNPERHYVGVAWYQRDLKIEKELKGTVEIELERVHWQSTVFIDGVKLGQDNSLSTPHRYLLNGLKKGKHTLTIRVDNRMIVDVGENAHSVSDHTQTNWNGIIGRISIKEIPTVFIQRVAIYPNIKQKNIRADIFLSKAASKNTQVKCQVIDEKGNEIGQPFLAKKLKGKQQISPEISMGNNAQLWSEFNPVTYQLKVSIQNKKQEETQTYRFGLREFKANGTRFEINGTPIFLRGTLNCCEFPYTGYPSMDPAYWAKIYRACKDYGLNHVRFHSWCPPEVAFDEADKAGVYLMVECCGWAIIGNGEPQDQWFYDESNRIVEEYGNHPSFCMMAYGNEPHGKQHEEYLSKFVTYWKEKDNRRAYTSASGWPYLKNADFNSTPKPRIQQWGEGLNSLINKMPPSTSYDWESRLVKDMPTVSHEIGQWCVYPDFKEIKKYTGFLKAGNFEIFRDGLQKKGMGNQAKQFLYASGKLQTLCYKADIEAAMRTKGFAGFQLLGLEDFPGQGTALVGVLNAFWESKGYVSGDEYSRFCNSVVPLIRFPKMVWLNNETMNVPVEIANFGGKILRSAQIEWNISGKNGNIANGSFTKDISLGNCIPLGNIKYDFQSIQEPTQLKVEVKLKGTSYSNNWNIWVYPSEKEKVSMPYITDHWDAETEKQLQEGKNVLLLTKGKVLPEKGSKIAVGFSSIFWNTAWTDNQPPHTLGILCNPKDPVFSAFPNDGYSDYQWWDIVSQSDAMILDNFPQGYTPLIQVIDDWVTNRKLGLLFEAKVGNGKLMVCSIDLTNNLDKRPAASQLKQSILKYMASSDFNPKSLITTDKIKSLIM